MIYFDEDKNAYNSKETIKNWGKTCIYECSDEKYSEFLDKKYIWENNILVENPCYDLILLERAKKERTETNDKLRNICLIKGVTYNNILFDSDTEQKVNLSTALRQFENPEVKSITWYGMDNTPLECTKEDLINISALIARLHSFCWMKNAEIKEQIKKAGTIEEVENIEVNYEN